MTRRTTHGSKRLEIDVRLLSVISSSRTIQEPRKWLSLSSECKNIELETLADQLSYPFFREMSEGEDEPVIDGPLIEGPVHVDYGFRINVSNFANMLGNCIIIYTPFSDVRFSEHSWINPGLTIIAAERSQSVNDKNGKPLTIGRKVKIGGCSWIGDDIVIL